MWQARSKRSKQAILGLTQALYSATPKQIAVKPPTKPKVKRKNDPLLYPSESKIQRAIVQWARLQGLPLISIPNHGKRSLWAGRNEVAMGLTKGVSDLFLARPVGYYAGMWIELKAKGKKPTVEQYEWLEIMLKEGYHAVWFDNIDDTKRGIVDYLAKQR